MVGGQEKHPVYTILLQLCLDILLWWIWLDLCGVTESFDATGALNATAANNL